MDRQQFKRHVEFLLSILPHVAKEDKFALKGGTAINLFVRDLPRLSVDIDLTYVGSEPRQDALELVEAALHRIKTKIEKQKKDIRVVPSHNAGLQNDIKLFVENSDVQIKVEVSPVTRGTVFPCSVRTLVPKAVKEFEVEVDMQVVSLGDLYGGKLVAALDRQHPRDIFDVKLLYENEGLTTEIKDGFLAYLSSHGRPFHEVLKPTLLNQKNVFESEFEGMTDIPYAYKDFEAVRKRLIKDIQKALTASDRKFLLSLAAGAPDWSIAPNKSVEALPAVQWKLQNIQKMKQSKRDEMVELLRKILEE